MIYAHSIYNLSSISDRCVEFLNCRKIQTCRPRVQESLHWSIYSEHKRFHFLMYVTITIPEGLLFALYGLDERPFTDLTILLESWWERMLEETLEMNGEQFNFYNYTAFMAIPYVFVPLKDFIADTAEL